MYSPLFEKGTPFVKKKILIVSAAANMIWQFNRQNILMLKSMDVDVVVGTNFENPGTISDSEVGKMKDWLTQHNVAYYQVDFKRGFGSMGANIQVIRQLRKIIRQEHIDFMHTQSPIGGVLGRIAAKFEHIKCIYTAHGFHFFKGAPKLNWLVFYPIEYICSYWTDALICINDEDFERAKHMHAKRVYQIHGVGLDVEKALAVPESEKQQRRLDKRKELNLSDDDFMILNVGEINSNKNQRLILDAMHQLNDSHLQLFIAGIGPLADEIRKLADTYGIQNQVHLLGYRNDIQDLHYAADVNVFPSQREGLTMAGIETVVDGLYLVGSNIRGIRDYILNENIGRLFESNNVGELTDEIRQVITNHPRISNSEIEQLIDYDYRSVNEQMKIIYQKIVSIV